MSHNTCNELMSRKTSNELNVYLRLNLSGTKGFIKFSQASQTKIIKNQRSIVMYYHTKKIYQSTKFITAS